MKILDTKKDNLFGTLYNMEHTDDPVTGINGQVYLDLTKYCDFDLDKIDNEVCLALSDADLSKYPTVTGLTPPGLQNSKYPIIFENQYLYEFDDDRKILENMTQMQIRKYLFFKKKISIPWFFILDLKPNTFKDRKNDKQPWSDFANKLQYTKQCIEQMPFKEIGRVVIYGSWPDSHVPCHRDELPTKDFGHHINFNPGGYRPLYVYDCETQTKNYLPDSYKFYALNTSDYHGVDPLPHFSYTIRVDGIYNDGVTNV